MPKSLQDLVRGMRGTSDEAAYISEILIDIHDECKSKRPSEKVEAISKLTFLYLLGYDIRPYAFNTIECMSNTDPVIKRTGYLASNFSFGSPDMQTLSTNLYINDLKNKSIQIKMMALSSLASCPAPNREQIHTVVPILFELLNSQQNLMSNIPLLVKLVATTLRLLILAKRQEIEGTSDFVPTFVEILFGLASAGSLTKDAIITQVYCHCALEIGRAFGQERVMQLVPSLYDILLTAKQPWILIEVSRFFGFMALYDIRIKIKVREQFIMLVNATESKSLLMELTKAVAEGYQDDGEIVKCCVKRMSDFIIPGQCRTDSNLKILALKNLAMLERATPGSIMHIDNLASELIKVLDDKDFNLRIVALDVIGSMANQQYLQNIVEKLLSALKDAKQMSRGRSLKDLHQISASDVQTFKKKVVQVILDSCSRNDFQNVTDFNWFVDVLITLSMEYPSFSADECSLKLLELSLKSQELKAVASKLVQILLQNEVFQNQASQFTLAKKINLQLNGPVAMSKLEKADKEVEIYSKLLQCKFGSSQAQTAEITAAIVDQDLNIFTQKYFKIMEENQQVYKKYKQEKTVYVNENREMDSEEIQELKSISNLLQTAAWIMGTFLCYQPAGEDAVNLYDCINTLMQKQLKCYTTDTSMVFVLSAFKAFAGLLYTFSTNNMFSDNDVCKQCIAEGFLQQFVITKELTDKEIDAEKARLKHQRDEKIKDMDLTFMSDYQKEQLMFIPEVEEVQVQYTESLLKMFVYSQELLLNKLKEYSLVPGLRQICNTLHYLTKSQIPFFKENVEKMENEELKTELLAILNKVHLSKLNEEILQPTIENIGTSILSINPEPMFTAQRTIQRPEFAFENGTMFSLDAPEGVLLNSYDMEEFQFEEINKQQMEKKEKRRRQSEEAITVPQADLFEQFVGQRVEERPTEMENTEEQVNEQMTQVFGEPKVKSAFYLDKNKLNKVENTQVQLGKYTHGIKVGSLATNKPVVHIEEVKKKRRRHGEEAPATVEAVKEAEKPAEIKFEPVAEQPKAEPKQQEEKPEPIKKEEPKAVAQTDDLAGLFM
ncbi:Conserved_hypothetical protein [Hexamita inflata]|uniref:Clathrin/coatomer adaptor adaptin-like N-terminal domain-containing protein n=1 Tax=Hexamita inflata TaxID=28002 RepID=A0AA86P773_9EUKA|nr:Conserved hypothetical protein [Hexamita inflata]